MPIPCGSTREAVCPACARKARIIRIQQCTEGWHLTDEPDRPTPAAATDDEDQDEDLDDDEPGRASGCGRPTKRRQNMPDLPKLKMSDRTVGQVFTTPTASSTGRRCSPPAPCPPTAPVLVNGAPRNPGHYDYRRAALDALHFSKLCGRLWSNLRAAPDTTCSTSPSSKPNAGSPRICTPPPAARSPRRSSARSSPPPTSPCGGPFDQAVYVDRLPSGPARARLRRPRHRRGPAHLGRSARPHRHRPGCEAGACDAVRHAARPAGRHPRARRPGRPLPGQVPHQSHRRNPHRRTHDQAYERHLDRLHAELRWLPCSPRCANWLRYGVQPDHAKPGLIPGQCRRTAHDRDNLGVTRRVLPSRLWSGKTVDQHKADRAEVVRQPCCPPAWTTSTSTGWPPRSPCPTGHPGSCGPTSGPTTTPTSKIILDSVGERQRWRAQYEHAKTAACRLGEFRQLPSRPDRPGLTTARPHPMTRQTWAGGTGGQG